VVVSEPVPPVPPSVPPWVQADKVMGRMPILRAKALAQRIFDKLEGFIVVAPLKVVNSRWFLIFKFKISETILSSF
jgi:hypothetical protein